MLGAGFHRHHHLIYLMMTNFDLTVVHETSRNDDNALDHEPPIVKETPIKNSYPATLESVSESTIIQ